MVKQRECPRCGRAMANPQRSERVEWVPRKVNGWVGNNFIPYESTAKGGKLRHERICGICYAQEQCGQMKQGGNDVTELETLLLQMAEKEFAGAATPANNGRVTKRPKPKVSPRRKRVKRPQMSASEATNFDSISLANATLVETALSCGCLPYVDVYTYRRWQAQGMQVARGSKAIRTPIVKRVVDEDPGTGEVRERKIMGNSVLFCRCQVAEREAVPA